MITFSGESARVVKGGVLAINNKIERPARKVATDPARTWRVSTGTRLVLLIKAKR